MHVNSFYFLGSHTRYFMVAAEELLLSLTSLIKQKQVVPNICILQFRFYAPQVLLVGNEL